MYVKTIHKYICIYICIYIYISPKNIYVYVYVYIHTHPCIYIYTHSPPSIVRGSSWQTDNRFILLAPNIYTYKYISIHSDTPLSFAKSSSLWHTQQTHYFLAPNIYVYIHTNLHIHTHHGVSQEVYLCGTGNTLILFWRQIICIPLMSPSFWFKTQLNCHV